jgi:hypothetical protein
LKNSHPSPLSKLFETVKQKSHHLLVKQSIQHFDSTMTRKIQLQCLLLGGCIQAFCLAMKECIDPIRTRRTDELTCSAEFSLVPKNICHYDDPLDDDCRDRPRIHKGSDVCAFVVESLFAEWKMLDGAFLLSGSCHASIAEGRFYPQDALRVLPENNELVGVRVRGVDLLSEIEKGLVDYYIHGDKDAYPHTAGLKYKLDLEQPAGRRIQNAKLLGFGCNWKPLKENDSYMILTDSVVADSVFSGRALAKSPSGVGETEALWRFASNVCFLKDNWHKMRLHHKPQKIPLESLEQESKPTVTSST